MNDRQRTLASYLLQRKDWVSQKQIKDDLHYTNERLIRADVQALNKGAFSYIIVSGDDGYKIADQGEAEAYLAKKRKLALGILARTEKMRHKLQNNGQLKVNNADNLVEVKTVCD